MQLLKCSTLLILLLLKTQAYAFSVKDCFKSDFTVSVKHKGWPLGLSNNILNISKSKCDIYFSHERVKYLKSAWHIDVCREPVHIKKGSGAVEVIKKTRECSKNSENSFCSEIRKLKENVQNDGLIFAAGSKEKLGSDHGKVYCAYGLLKLYEKGHIIGSGNIDKLTFLSHKIDVVKEKAKEEAPLRPIIEGQSDVTDELEDDDKEIEQEKETVSEELNSSTTRSY